MILSNWRFFQRTDTAANWSTGNPILGKGEVGVDETNNQIRVGDGVRRWNALPAMGTIDAAQLAQRAQAAVDAYVGDTPEGIQAVARQAALDYLAANPPAGGGTISATPHPTFPGVFILTSSSGGGGTTPPAGTAPTIEIVEAFGYVGSSVTVLIALTGDPMPTEEQFFWEHQTGTGAWTPLAAIPDAALTEWYANTAVPAAGIAYRIRITVTTSAGTDTVTADVPR